MPLLEHSHLLESADDIHVAFVCTKADTVAHYSKVIVSHLTSFLPGAGEKGRSGKNIKVTGTMLRELKKTLKERLQAKNRDQMYHSALLRFYDDVLKKRATFVMVSTGLTYEDLVQIFSASVQQEIKTSLAATSTPEGIAEILEPYNTAEDAYNGRVQEFIELLKGTVDRVCLEEVSSKRAKHHKRNSSANTESTAPARFQHKRNTSAKNQSILANNPEEHEEIDTKMPTGGKLSMSLGAGLDKAAAALSVSPDEVPEYHSQECHFMLEWTKEAFMVSRDRHEKAVNRISHEPTAQMIVKDFQERLRQLERDSKIEEENEYLTALYGLTQDSFHRFNKAGFFFWRKLEKQDMLKHVARLTKLYIKPVEDKLSEVADAEKNEKAQSLSGKVRIRVLVVEARNLTIKDNDGKSDPYVVVEYGHDQRYQTEVVAHSLQPYWNQEIALEIKADSKSKVVKIVIWDHDEVKDFSITSPFSTKFWKEESDDFLGQVTFSSKDLIEELAAAPRKRFDKWLPLQKRSKRSTVSGEIHLIVDIDNFDPTTAASVTDSVSIEEPVESEELIFDVSKMTPVFKPKFFANYHLLYKNLVVKLLEYDARVADGALGDGSLSKISESILEEIGERWRLNKVWREVCYFKILSEQYRDPPSVNQVTGGQGIAAVATGPSVATLIAAFTRTEQLIMQVKSYLLHIKVLCPQSVDVMPDGTKIVNQPVISGIGNLVMSDDTVAMYVDTLVKTEEFLKWQVQRYKDCFPCDTPVGGLVSTISMLSMLFENEWAHPEHCAQLASPDSGLISPDEKTGEKEREFVSSQQSLLEPFTEQLSQLVRIGTVERYMRMSELASPQQDNQVLRLIKLADLIMEEIESDITYFQKPFAAYAQNSLLI